MIPTVLDFATTTSSLSGHDDPFMGFPTGFKFFLLRKLGNDFLSSFGDGTLYHDEAKLNDFSGAITQLNATLLSFGFISDYKKVVLKSTVPEVLY